MASGAGRSLAAAPRRTDGSSASGMSACRRYGWQVREERGPWCVGGGREPGVLAVLLGEIGAGAVEVALRGTRVPRRRRDHEHEAIEALGCAHRGVERRRAAHRRAAGVDAVEAELVEEREQVGGEPGPLVGRRLRGPAGLAVAGGVVAHDLAAGVGDRVPSKERQSVLAGAAAREPVAPDEGGAVARARCATSGGHGRRPYRPGQRRGRRSPRLASMNSRTNQQSGATRLPSRPEIVECALHELGAEALAAEVTDHFRVGQHDDVAVHAVVGDGDHLAVELELVARSIRGVAKGRVDGARSTRSRLDRNPCVRLARASEATPRPGARQPPRLDDERSERVPVTTSRTTTCSRTSTGPVVRPRRSRASRSSVHGSPGSPSPGSSSTSCGCSTWSSSSASCRARCSPSARWERVVLRRCRMSGIVAAELHATDVRLEQCKADQAWLRAVGARPVRDRRHGPARCGPLRRSGDALGVPAVRPHRGRRVRLALRAGVAPRIHHRPARRAPSRCSG